jgi:NAD(P) transhydrogenase
MSEHFDLVVVGAGPAGEKGAVQAAYFGKRVCVIERAPKPGGTAVNAGAVHAQALRETALHFSTIRQRGLLGVDVKIRPDIAFGDFTARERSITEAMWEQIHENLVRHQVEVAQGAATFVDSHTLSVTRYGKPDRLISGDHVLLATGARPRQPEGTPVDGEVIVDYLSLPMLEKIPATAVVIGGGAIGCQYASLLAAIGTRVHIVTSRSRLLAHLDREIGETLKQQMTARLGVSVHLGVEVTQLEVVNGERAHVVLSDDTPLNPECVIYCAGRLGNVEGLGLDRVGVRFNHRGFIEVDSAYRTSVPHIWAAGDVIGFPALASTSMEQARIAVCQAFDLKYKKQISNVIPYGLWTIPEFAIAGESEEMLRAREVPFEVGRAFYRANPRGQIINEPFGFVKLLFHREDQRLLGVVVYGEGASELVHIGSSCLSFGGGLDYFIQSVFTYPSLGDAYKYAAYDGLQQLAKRAGRMPGLPMTPVSNPAIAG